MPKTWKKWTLQENEQLKISWKYSTMENLLKEFPDRTYQSLMKQAALLKVRSEINRKRIGSLNFLDLLTPKSSYWWGFIMADGHLARRGDLSIQLNVKDKEHLLKLANYLGCNLSQRSYINNFNKKETTSIKLCIADKNFANKWLDLLKIDSPKTYTPPNLDLFLTKENLIYFFIGFIDGDGCIWVSKNWPQLRIELHKNWLLTLELISLKLKEFYNIECKIFLNKRGNANLSINTKNDLNVLRTYINEIDFMERKWNILK